MAIDLGKISVVKNVSNLVKNPTGGAGVLIGISNPTNYLLSKSRYQRSYNWDVVLPDISSVFGQSKGILGQIGKVLEGVQGLAVAQYCQGVTFGDYNITDLATMRYGPYQANYAGMFNIEKVSMTFLKPMPDFVTMYFTAWKNLIIDQNGLYNVSSKYKKTVYVRFLDSTGISIQRYKLLGCFPSKYPSYALNYDDNNVSKITVELSCDKVEIQ